MRISNMLTCFTKKVKLGFLIKDTYNQEGASMKLMTISEYLQTCYTKKSRPNRRTIIRHINEGYLAGKRLGRTYYIDVDVESGMTGNPLVDQVLAARGA